MRLGRLNYRFTFLLWLIGSLLLAPYAFGRTFPATSDPVAAAQQRWGTVSQGYVVQGCTHTTSISTSVSVASCRAFALDTADPDTLRGFEETVARTITYSGGDGTYWLAGRANVAITPAGWTSVAGTHYLWRLSTTKPAIPTGMVLLRQAIVLAGAITEVGDHRPDSPFADLPANLMSPMYGAVRDCTTDDTVAVQTWINNVRWRGTTGYAPPGCYEVTRLWLAYDAANNPGFPSNVGLQGDFRLMGAGSIQINVHDFLTSDLWNGTIFLSTETAAPMLNAFGAVGGASGNPLRGIKVEGFSFVQTTTSVMVDINGLHQGADLSNLFIVNRGTGGGMVWKNLWNSRLKDMIIYTPTTTAGSNVGIGLHVTNEDTVGGIIQMDNVTVRNFGSANPTTGECIRLGSPVTANRFQSLDLRGVQAGSCPIGMHLMHAIRGMTCTGCYFEGYKIYAILMDNTPQGVHITGSWFAGTQMANAGGAGIRIGAGAGGLPFGARGVMITNNVFVDTVEGYAIWRDVGAEVVGAVIEGNVIHVGPAPALGGIYCGTGGIIGENTLSIRGNVFDGAGTNTIDATCTTADTVATPLYHLFNRRVNFGQGVSIASAAAITIPGDGNVYNLTGNLAVTTFTCAECLPGAMLWFYVTVGNAPTINEGGNIVLDDTAANTWTGAQNDVIAFVYTTTGLWHEMFRKAN